MDTEQPQLTLTLIYHNLRGMAQPIRYVLYYLKLPFQEILLKQGQNLSELDVIKRVNSHGNGDLPCLIHGNNSIHSFFAILRYLCTITNREDLLGENLEQRTLIREVFYNFLEKKTKEMKLFFGFGEKVAKCPEKKEQIRKIAMEKSHDLSGSVIPLTKLKLKNLNQKYILGHITLLDFLLFEDSFYQINLFGCLEMKNCKLLEVINSIFQTNYLDFKDKSSLYLRVLRQFKERFEKEQEFYVKNKQKLDSYSIFCPRMSEATKEAFKNVWLGPQNVVS